MHNGKMRRAALMIMAAMPCAAHAADVAAPTPASAWKISSEPYACHLERSFGEGAQSVELQLRRQVTMGPLRWIILFPSQDRRSARVDGSVEKLPQQEKSNFEGARAALSSGGQNYLMWKSAATDEAFADDQILRITASGKLNWSLQASNMAKAVAGLDACASGLRKDLGYNENVAVKPEPVMDPHPGYWATNDDYPQQSRRNRDEGIVSFLLMVSETGTVADCHILESSGFTELDAKTCALMRERAKFHPAKDAKGDAVSSQYTNRVMWKLPQ
jgi:TonB family protein